jgi:hypothetical protein
MLAKIRSARKLNTRTQALGKKERKKGGRKKSEENEKGEE